MDILAFLHSHLNNIHPDNSTYTPGQTELPPVPAAPANDPGPDGSQGYTLTGHLPQAPQPSHAVDYPDAPHSPPLSNGPTPPDLGNRAILEAAHAANTNNEKANLHHGLFGMHGTLRDVVGLLGDAFLVQSGHAPMYSPARAQEKEGGAMAGFSQGGQQASNAMERVAQENPSVARDMWKTQQEYEYKKAASQVLSDERRAKTIEGLRDRAARLAHFAGNDPQKVSAADAQITALAQANGLDPQKDLGWDPTMSDADREVYGHGDMSSYNQERIPMQQQGADARTETAHAASQNAQTNRMNAGSNAKRADAAMISATRPRPGPVAHQTELEYAKQITTPGHQQTSAEADWLKNRYYHKSSNGLFGAVPPPAAAPSNRFRVVGVRNK